MQERKNLNILLKESWDFFSERWNIFFKIAIFIWIPAIFVFSFFGIFLLGTFNILKTDKTLLFSPKVILSAVTLILFLAFILTIAALVHQIIRIRLIDLLLGKKGEPYYLNLSALVKESIPELWVIGLAEGLAAILIIFGIILLVFPCVLFAIWFAFVPYEVVLKKKRGWDALLGSRKIIRHSIGKYVGNTLVMFAILILINISVSGLFQLFVSPFKSDVFSVFVGELASTIVSSIFGIWGAVFSFMLYKELDERYNRGNEQISSDDNQVVTESQ